MKLMTMMIKVKQARMAALLGVALAGLAGCGEKAVEEKGDITAEVEAYYAANPEFFTFATPEDLPQDLEWKDGSEQGDIGSPEAKKGGTFNYYVHDFPRTFRTVGPDASMGFRSYILDYNSMGLTSAHPDTLEHIPAIALQWAIGPDKKTVYYRLDPEAKYSDGHPVRARDFLFTFFFNRSPHIKEPWNNDYYTKKFTNITMFDDLTISLTYSEAKPDLLDRTSLRPVPQHYYSEFGEDYLERYNYRFEPTTGPYEILDENVKKGRSVTLTKVKNGWWLADRKFYRHCFNPDKLHIRVIRDPDKVFEVFLKGELDAQKLDVPEYWYQKLPDDAPEVQTGHVEKITFYNEVPGPDFALRMNTAKPPLDDINVREGVQYACNWDLVIKEVFYGDYQRMNTVSDGYGACTHPTLKARGFDPEKAEAFFGKAGFTKRGPDGILEREDGKRLSLTITTGYKRFEDVLTVLKQEAKKAGLEFNLEIMEQTAAWKKADEKKHEIVLTALNRGVSLFPRYWDFFHSYNAYEEDGSVKTSTNNDTQTALPELDEIIDRYRASDDMEEIIRLSHELSQKVHDYAAYVPGWKMPWYRMGKQRWLRYPSEFFDHRTAREFDETRVFWIDEDMKKETEEAKKSGKTFPPVIKVYDQWKKE